MNEDAKELDKPEVAARVRGRILSINVVQTWLLAISLGGTTIVSVFVWMNGWSQIPERVTVVEARTASITNMEMRLDTQEATQILVWKKLNDDHDILIEIKQSVADQKEQTREMREDIKRLKK